MERARLSFVWCAFVAVVGAAAVGCGPAVRNVTVRSAASIAPSASEATIVVVQPSTRYSSVNILDGQGRLLGQISDRSHTVVRVPPGTLRLYAIPEREASWGDRIDGHVEAGRVYYATIGMRWGGITFLALNPRSRDDRWSHRDEYLGSTPLVEMDLAQVPLAVQELGDTAPLLARVDQNVDRLDEAHREERTIRPEDGL